MPKKKTVAKKKAAKKKVSKKKPAKKKAAPRSATKKEPELTEFDPIEHIASLGLKPEEYNEKEILFCYDYVSHFNGSKAVKNAGYDVQQKYLSRMAYKLTHRPKCAALINALKKERFQRLQMTDEDILAEWATIGRFDVRNLYDETGRLLQPHELDEETAKCVVGLKVREEHEGRGDEREHVADILEYKIIDKHTALTNYARHKAMFKDTVTVEPGEELTRLLDAIDGKTIGPPGQRGKD